MLFMVRMRASLPDALTPEQRDHLITIERDYSQDLQRRKVWLHLWREVGQLGNVSIFDVASLDDLHAILCGLPFHAHLTRCEIVPLVAHPSELTRDK